MKPGGSKSKKNILAGCVVRECDEVEKGKFVAYVDEQDRTFDVTLQLDPGKKIQSYTCDCGAGSVCRHIVALHEHITVKKKSTRKKDEIASPVSYTQQQVTEICKTAYATLVQPGTFPDKRILVKLARQFSKIHQPILQFYLQDLFDKNRFEVFYSILDFTDQLNVSTLTKDPLYNSHQGLLTMIIPQVEQLADESKFALVIELFISKLNLSKESGVCLIKLLNELIALTTPGRIDLIIEKIATAFKDNETPVNFSTEASAKIFQKLLVRYNRFAEFAPVLPARSVGIETNLEIIQLLIDEGRLNNAAERGWSLLGYHWKISQKIRLLQCLLVISTELQDNTAIAQVYVELLPLNFEFEDLKKSYEYLAPDAALKLRTKLLLTASEQLHRDPQKFRFVFELFRHENKPAQMLRLIGRTPSYALIREDVEMLIEQDSMQLLIQLLRIQDKIHINVDFEHAQPEFEAVRSIVNLLIKRYDRQLLYDAVRAYHVSLSPGASMNYLSRSIHESLGM